MSAIPTGAVIADKGYDSNALIEAVEASGAQAIIPPRSNRTTQRKTERSAPGDARVRGNLGSRERGER